MTPEEIARKLVEDWWMSTSASNGTTLSADDYVDLVRTVSAAIRKERETPCAWCMNGEAK